MKKVLVTGADGFIGSHLTEQLVKEGYDVRALVYYNSFNSNGWLDEIESCVKREIDIVSGDIRDPFGVRSAMQECQFVLNLAALIAIPYSYHSPASYIETNVTGALNIVQAARDLDVEMLIQTSTSEVYGTAQYVPIDELHPLHAQSPYAATKIAADQLVLSYYAAFQTPVTVIRPFNTYGPRQSARAVIPTIIGQLANGQDNIQLGAVHPTRDFNFIEDTVAGFLAAIRSPQAIGEVINIGSNYEVSIGETAEMICSIMGSELTIETDDKRLRPEKSEVERLWASNDKAKELLGWQPQYAGKDGFQRGLRKTIEWFTEKDNLRRYKTDVYNI